MYFMAIDSTALVQGMLRTAQTLIRLMFVPHSVQRQQMCRCKVTLPLVLSAQCNDAHADTAHGAGDPVCLPATPQLPASLLYYNDEWAMEVRPSTVQLCERKHNQAGISQETLQC